MNSKTKIVIFITSIFLLSVISGCVKEGEKVGEMDVGDMFANFFEKLAKFFKKEIEWPTAFGKTQKMQLWIPVTAFFIMFMLVWAVSKKHIKIFEDQKNIQTIFSFAFSLAVMFGTPFLNWWAAFIGLFGAALWVGLFIVGTYFMWAMLSRGQAEASSISAQASKTRADAKKMKKDTKKIKEDIEEEVEVSERIEKETEDLQQDVEKEKTTEGKIQAIDEKEKRQQEIVKDETKKLDQQLELFDELSDPSKVVDQRDEKIQQQAEKIKVLSNDLKQRIEYIKQLEEYKINVEKDREEVAKKEKKTERKEKRFTRKGKRELRKEFTKITDALKRNPDAVKKAKLMQQRKDVIEGVWGNKTLRQIESKERTISNKIKKLSKDAQDVIDKKIKSANEMENAIKRLKKPESFRKRMGEYIAAQAELDSKAKEIEAKIVAKNEELHNLVVNLKQVNLNELQRELNAKKQAKKK